MSRDALIVGINTYQDHNLRNLNAPATDAEDIARMLEDYGDFNVWRLPEAIDEDTRKPFIAKTQSLSLIQLKEALVKLFKPEGRQVPDTALFYFSGHGIREEKGIQEGFIATSNVDTNSGFNGLSLRWLRHLLQESSIQQQIIWLDCCHSGEIINFNKYDPGEQGQARDRCFIAASRDFESSYEDLNSSYSILTRVLLEGLNPHRSPQKWITNYSLIEFINQNLRHQNQRPVFTNFGSAINLTCTLDTKTSAAKGQNSNDICPYKGLEYFDCNDSDPQYFYGREKLTDELIKRVRQNNFLAILGASGSGKSSILRAGLLHQLKLGRKLAGSQDWKIQIMLPGAHPLQSLAFSWLAPNLSDIERATQLDHIESLLQQGGEGLRKLVQASTANRVILVIDQFEEVFTLCQDLSERENFFQCILETLEQEDNKLCLIIAMRIDFWGKCYEHKYSGLLQKINKNSIQITPMTQEELIQAIVKPAEKADLKIELQLREQILVDIEDSPGTLVLLQYTLTELWKKRKDNYLKLNTYSKIGGIGGTLDKRATEVYESFNEEQKKTVKHIFLCLTKIGEEGTDDTRKRVSKQELITTQHPQDLVDIIIKKLADYKLVITSNQIGKNSENSKDIFVEVIHESLIRKWKLLRDWLDISRANLYSLKQREIEAVARNWQLKGQSDNYLLQGELLKEAKDFNNENQEEYPLSESTIKFIIKSTNWQTKIFFKTMVLFSLIPLLIVSCLACFSIIKINQKHLIMQYDLYKKTINQCEGIKLCPGRLNALEKLVLAKINLTSYNLADANLQGADLPSVNLENSNLMNVNLEAANLINSNLKNSNFKGAKLNDAFLVDANLNGSNLENAYTERTYLKNAILINVKNFTYSQIKQSCFWEQAIFKGHWDTKENKWVIDEIENKNYIKQIKQDKSSDPTKAIDCPS